MSQEAMLEMDLTDPVAAAAEKEHEPLVEHENEQDAQIDRMYQHIIKTLMSVKGGNANSLGGNPAGPANAWHSRRRAELLKIPGVKTLLHDCSYTKLRELLISIATIVVVFLLHIMLALALSSFARGASFWAVALAVLLTSTTIGGQCAFVLQGLNHELGHGASMVDLPRIGRQVTFLMCFTLGSLGAALCHIPWTSYYMGGGHFRHHRFVGTARDIDEDALFVLYKPFDAGFVQRVAWLSVAAAAAPIMMFYSLGICAFYDWRGNIKEFSCVVLDFALTGIAYYNVGSAGMVYLYLSSLFSMGFLAHPLIGFWIVQHLCVGGAQPTVSYNGSGLWNILCLNELLHVEHHDFACIPWRHLPKLRALAPEFYESLHNETSIMGLISAWVRAGGPNGDKRFSWDFACRTEWHYTRNDEEALAHAHAVATSAMMSMATPSRSIPASADNPLSAKQQRLSTTSEDSGVCESAPTSSPQRRRDVRNDPFLMD